MKLLTPLIMKKLFAFNILTISVTICIYFANYLLLSDNYLHISISSFVADANRWHGQSHIVVLGLLPIYIATMIFGASLLGIYLSFSLQHLFFLRSKTNQSNKPSPK